ncbi:MAG: DUF2958 domain-containing protein [Phycisphaerales bacterium]|nr:DUF2958 domain-containing protein [Phycisphaerales bacterium]
MWNKPTYQQLSRLPALYSTESTSWCDKIIHEHFLIGGCDWYAAEWDPDDRRFFGYAILNQDYQNAEWGYFSLDEMDSINIRGLEIDRDLHWDPRPAGTIDDIVRGMEVGRE